MSYVLDVTERLVADDTVPAGSAEPALAWVAEELEGHGFRVALHRYPGREAPQANLIATAGPPEADGLILSGHIDVVPFAEQPGWTRDPLRLEAEGDVLHGRGTSDMKGFLAQCLDAARRLDTGRLERPLVFLFTAEEEIGCRGAGKLVEGLADRLDVPLPSLAWIGEPTSGRVFHAHKGVVAFEIEVEGIGGHSSVPEAGVNAIAVAARIMTSIGDMQADLRANPDPDMSGLYPEAPYTTLNFGTIRGGSAANMIAESCRFDVSYRPLPGEDPKAVHGRIRDRLESLVAHDFGSDREARIRVSDPMVAPGLLARRGTPLEAVLRERTGDQAEGGAPFCTDGGQFARAGIDSIICGPGDLAQAHQPDEWIRRAALEGGVDDVMHVIRSLCGGEGADSD